MKKWKSLSSKLVFKNPFLDFYEYQVERPNGKIFPYYCVEKHPSCIIIPVDGEYTYLIGQYRFAARKESWEFPGGGAEKKNPEKSAKKELKEELGIRSKKIVFIGSFFINTGYSNQECFVYSAHGLTQGKIKREALEFLESRKVQFKKFEAMIKKGKVIDSSTISAYYLYLANVKKTP